MTGQDHSASITANLTAAATAERINRVGSQSRKMWRKSPRQPSDLPRAIRKEGTASICTLDAWPLHLVEDWLNDYEMFWT